MKLEGSGIRCLVRDLESMQSANGCQNSVELFFLGKLPGSSQGWVWLTGCILAMGYK